MSREKSLAEPGLRVAITVAKRIIDIIKRREDDITGIEALENLVTAIEHTLDLPLE